jgi:phage repressor protein C with HTH and peptisase S24 domain
LGARSPLVFSYDKKDVHLKFEVVPRYSVRASAGPGAGEHEGEQLGEFAFEVGWMRKNLGRAGRGFASVEVHGDSMQPTLLNGDEIIIDSHVQRVDVSGIYVIGLRGDLLVKRVQRKLDGSLVVKSDNPAYEPETIAASGAEEFRVIGRMVWPRVR